jgi:hypothetical protein
MDLQAFADYHLPALETDEVRYNVQIAAIATATKDVTPLHRWTLGGPGHCATRSPGYGILLGALEHAECVALAGHTRDLDYSAVIGSDEKALWFVEPRGRSASPSGTPFRSGFMCSAMRRSTPAQRAWRG